MKDNKTRTRNIAMAFCTAIAYILLFKGAGMAIKKLMNAPAGSLLPDLSAEIAGTVIAVTMLIVFGKTRLLRAEPGSFKKGLGAGAFMIAAPMFLLLTVLPSLSGRELKPAHEIAFFAADMILTGVTEEFVYRGTVFDFFHEAFGSSGKAQACTTAAFSGCIFGMLHLFNMIGSEAPSAVIIQAVSAAATGFFFGAVYLRCRNLWAMAALHAFNDFAVMFDKGVFAGGTIRSAIDSHSVKVLIGAVLYVAIGIYLLRGEKMNYTDSGNDTLRQHRTTTG